MNWELVEGKWQQLKGSARMQWARLTDNDVELIAGKRERLVGKIQERYGIAKEEAERQVKEWKPVFDPESAEHRSVRKAG